MMRPRRRAPFDANDPDATLLVNPRPRVWRVGLGITAALALLLVLHRLRPQQTGAPPAPPLVAATQAATFPLADEAAILAAPPDRLTIWRLLPAPSVLVVIFPTLHAQALTLNRVAAFVEKAGLPHDRVLTLAEFEASVPARQFDRYYYGHDYRAADLARFFATAARDGVALRAEEQALRDLLDAAGLLAPGAVGALISLPASGETRLDATTRAAALHHEISHGVYFTDASYAAYVRSFWETHMTEPERAAFRHWLGHGGYDMTDEDLMRNEMQAYLVFTPDKRLFDPTRLGLSAAEPVALRAALVAGIPLVWLRARAVDKN